jgi:O-antigen biosynthesis protein
MLLIAIRLYFDSVQQMSDNSFTQKLKTIPFRFKQALRDRGFSFVVTRSTQKVKQKLKATLSTYLLPKLLSPSPLPSQSDFTSLQFSDLYNTCRHYTPDIPLADDPQYGHWLLQNYPRSSDLQRMKASVAVMPQPRISIVMPVYNTPKTFLNAAIASVIDQVYPHWELCIADDASTAAHIKPILDAYVAKDSRVKVVYRSENGHISQCSNSALAIATGEFVALLDHDDVLTPDALYEVAVCINQYPDVDFIYSDEDKLDAEGRLSSPFFKPDWCPDSFLSRMYTCHLGVYRRSRIQEIGGFRVGLEGSQDYDLVLRLSERTDRIFHIPKILYHWRIHPDSAADRVDAKTYAFDASQQALSEALQRRGECGQVFKSPHCSSHYLVRYKILEPKKVSIIIPSRNLGEVLGHCLNSIFQKSTYPNYEVVVIDNGSTEQSFFQVVDIWKAQEPQRFVCLPLNIPFNFSKLNNYAVAQTKGDFLLFLNNDTEVITPDWLEGLVEQAQRPSIGAVGALLLYPDDTIQHAGVVVGIGGVAGHSHKYKPVQEAGYFNQIHTINNYLAVTAACLMCKRSVFQEVGGFEESLQIAFNDVDLCLKLVANGYQNIYLPHVQLYHYESKSRGYEDTPQKQHRFRQEIAYMQTTWSTFITHDTCYSPNLSRQFEDYRLRIEPEHYPHRLPPKDGQ